MINPHKPLTNFYQEDKILFKNSIRSKYYSSNNKPNQPKVLKKQIFGDVPHISDIFPTLKKICGDNDERVTANNKDLPYRLICKIIITTKSNHRFRATGFFISKKCVITAGHCVFPDGDWAQSIEVIPGENMGSKPYGTQKSEKFKSVAGWIEDSNKNYDYGAIILNDDYLYENIGGCFDFNIYNKTDKKHHNSGYPYDFDSVQKTSNGLTKPFNENLVNYNIDTHTGNSGSPLFEIDNENYTVVGVHTYGKCPNHAVRTTRHVISNWKLWIEESELNI